MTWFTDPGRSRDDRTPDLEKATGSPQRSPSGHMRKCRRPAFERLERRQLLAAGLLYPGDIARPPSGHALRAAPIAGTRDTEPTQPSQQDAIVTQYGPAPDQRTWTFLPPDPNGRLDLVVHGGGFRKGEPNGSGLLQFVQTELARGMTVVSIGYRKLGSSRWPTPVDDIAAGIDAGFRTAQAMTGDHISDITETGLSAGGTALALINYSPLFASTTTVPNRIITISSPLEADDTPAARAAHGFWYTEILHWRGIVPKARTPITLMGTPGDPIAIERGNTSTIGQFARYLGSHNIPVSTYFDPHHSDIHGKITRDFQRYPDVAAALWRAQDFDG